MHTLHTVERLCFAVLRKQGDGRHWLACQHAFQIGDEREARAFDDVGRFVRAQLGALHIFLHCGFERTQDQRWRHHAHHVQRAAGLVQLLARHAQWTHVQGSKIGFASDFGITHKTAHGLDCGVQRFAQFIKHPRERTQVLLAVRPISDRSVDSLKR